MEVPSDYDGEIIEVLVKEGHSVSEGMLFAKIKAKTVTSTKKEIDKPTPKTTILCHEVLSFCSWVFLSFHLLDVAMEKDAIFLPDCIDLISGSLPRFPNRITLFTLPTIKKFNIYLFITK